MSVWMPCKNDLFNKILLFNDSVYKQYSFEKLQSLKPSGVYVNFDTSALE